MLLQLADPHVPHPLQGPLLIDSVHGLPRYWAAVWSLLEGSSLARSSLTKKLRQIESLYAHTDLVFGPSFLDDALGTVNDALLSDMLESWFISIKNQSDIGPSDEARWRAGLSFVVCIITRLSKANLPTERLRRLEARLHRLSHLYGQLHVQRNRRLDRPEFHRHSGTVLRVAPLELYR